MDIRSKVIVKNTVYLYMRLLVSVVIGFITSREILRILGVDDFGILNLVGGVVTLFVFVNQALTASTTRYLTYDMGRGQVAEIRDTFSVCMNVHIIFSAFILVALEIAGLILLNGVLNIAPIRITAAHWVFQCMVASSILGILRVPYSSIITADEKFGFLAAIGILEPLLKLLILYVLLICSADKLILYSILFLGITVFSTLLMVGYCLAKYPLMVKFKLSLKVDRMKEFLKFSGMSLYEQIAVVCSYQGVDFLLNVHFGVVVNAAMGIAKQVQAAVFNFISGFQGAMSPQITKSYASGDTAYLAMLMKRVPKFSIYLSLILALPVMFNLKELLKIWLVHYPPYTEVFCYYILISCVLEAVSMPYRTLVYAKGKIVKYQLIVGSCFMMNLILSYFFLLWGFPPQTVLIIRVAIYFVIDVVRIWFYREFETGDFLSYLFKTYGRVVLVLVVTVPLLMLVNQCGMHLFVRLAISFAAVGGVIYLLGLTSGEKKAVVHMALAKLHLGAGNK